MPCQSVHTTFCASRQVILALLVRFHSVGFSPLFHLLRFLEMLFSWGVAICTSDKQASRGSMQMPDGSEQS